jgi:hypothetical protein
MRSSYSVVSAKGKYRLNGHQSLGEPSVVRPVAANGPFSDNREPARPKAGEIAVSCDVFGSLLSFLPVEMLETSE